MTEPGTSVPHREAEGRHEEGNPPHQNEETSGVLIV